MKQRILTITTCSLLIGVGFLTAQDPDIIHLGMLDSLVKDLTPGKQKIVESEFPDMVKEFTGFQSKLFQGGDPFTGAKKLADGQWHLGVFQGVEFAWAQSKDPKLRPLMIAVGQEKTIRALVVAKKDSPVKSVADLKGKNIHLLTGREHCRLFADKAADGDAKKHFGKVSLMNNTEMALDDILRGKVEAVVADNTVLENYKSVKPGSYNRLKIVAESETFPATTIAYREGGLNEKAREQFKRGMLKANETDKGRDMMANFNVYAFEPAPADYPKQLEAILKAYPAPGK